MKMLIVSATLLTAFAASATEVVLKCKNPATGAEFDLSTSSTQSPRYQMNSILFGNLKEQGDLDATAEGEGGKIYPGVELSYMSDRLTVFFYNGGWLLHAGPAANFYFSPGECRNGGI